MARLARFVDEIIRTPYYRGDVRAAFRYAHAKWVFSRYRKLDPRQFLVGVGINPEVALMGYENWSAQLDQVVSIVQSESGGQGGIGPKDGMILYGLARALRPDYVIETGVAAGVSTSFFAAALVENNRGVLFSIELPPADRDNEVQADGSKYAWQRRGVGWAVPQGLRHALGSRHQLILADVRFVLPDLLKHIPYVDLFFHDDLHTPDHMVWEYEQVWPKLRPGGVLVSDDVNYGWIEFCKRLGRFRGAFDNVDRLCALRKPIGGHEIPNQR